MRTIKFRTWDDNMMIYLPFNKFDDECSSILFQLDTNIYDYGICGFSDIGFNYSKILIPIIMQFTGLTDKNGKEIYEGDIVTYKRSVGNWTGQFMTTTHKIVFSEQVFAFVMEYGSQYIKLRKHWNYEYEVIGNIYENPEIELKN